MATSACREPPVRSTLSFNTFRENINTLRQTSRHDIPSTVGVLCFENPLKNTKSISCYWFLYSSKVIHILNSCFQILYMCFLKQYTYLFSVLAYCACVFPVIIHAGSLFFALKHVFSDLLYIPNYDFWVIRMCFLLFFTYLIPVFELSACISWFFAHTRFLFLTSAHVFSNALSK